MNITRDADYEGSREGTCEQCGTAVYGYRTDRTLDCDQCGAVYSIGGQRYRDDYHTRPNRSEWDDVGDMEGYETAYSGE